MTNEAHNHDVVRSRPPRQPRLLQKKGFLIALGVVVTVAALAVVPRAFTRSTGRDQGAAASSTASLPTYVGPKVDVSALRSYTWRALPPAPIVGRYSEAAAWTGSSMIFWGGTSGNDVLGDGAAYDPSSRRWSMLAPAPLQARVGPSGVWAGGAFLVWGGSSGSEQLADGARYDPRTNRWKALAPAPVASWGQQQMVVAGDRVVLLTTPPGHAATTIRASSYDPARNSWATLPDLLPPKNHDVDQVVALGVGTTVFVWSQWAHTVADAHVAGATTTRYGVDAFRLHADSGSWSNAPVKPGEEFTASNPLWTGERIILPQNGRYCGGCSGPPLSDPQAVLIDPHTGDRRTLPTGPVTGTYSWTGGALIAVNASSTGGPKRLKAGDTAAYDPASGRWTRLAGKPANTAAEEAVQIWTGDRLIVWGLDFGPKSTHARGAEFAPPR